MGVSTDAYIAYGIDLGDDPVIRREIIYEMNLSEDDYDIVEVVEDYVERYLGIPDGASYEERKAYLEQKYGFTFPWKDGPLCIDTHCASDFPMYIAYIGGTRVSARRGEPKRFMTVEPTQEALSEFVMLLRRIFVIEEDARPDWLLYSYWSY